MRAIPVDIQTACCCCWKRNVVLQKVNFSETTKKEKHFSLMNIAFIHSWKSPHLKLTVRLKCRSDSAGQIQGHLTRKKVLPNITILFSMNVQSWPESITLLWTFETWMLSYTHGWKKHGCNVTSHKNCNNHIWL